MNIDKDKAVEAQREACTSLKYARIDGKRHDDLFTADQLRKVLDVYEETMLLMEPTSELAHVMHYDRLMKVKEACERATK